jgi:UPF0716 protein FxsA
MVKWLIAVILFLPIAEIAVFILVAASIGVLWTLALMLTTTLAGVLTLRRAGRAEITRLRVAVADTDKAGIDSWIDKIIEANAGGFLTVLAGVLLFVPGFLTDILGGLLLIGPLRRRFGTLFRRWLRSRNRATHGVIDLAPGDWEQVPDPMIKDGGTRRRE